MKFNWNIALFFVGVLLILGFVWAMRPVKTDTSNEYRKIDSVMNVIEQRQLRDSIRAHKADSIMGVVSNNNNIISGFVSELNQINHQLDQTITNINGLNATDLVILYSNQLPSSNSK